MFDTLKTARTSRKRSAAVTFSLTTSIATAASGTVDQVPKRNRQKNNPAVHAEAEMPLLSQTRRSGWRAAISVNTQVAR